MCAVAQAAAAERQMPLQSSEAAAASAEREGAEGSARPKQPRVSSASNIDHANASAEEQCDSCSSTEEFARRGLGGKPASQSLRYHKTSEYSPLEVARDPKGQVALQKASQLAREHPTLRAGSASLEPPLPAGGSGHNIAAAADVVAGDARANAPSRPPIQRSFTSSESLQKKVSLSDSRKASATGSASLSRHGSGLRKASTTSLDKQGADEQDQAAPNFKVRLLGYHLYTVALLQN